jgi:nucleotide-binding universal stress UspA family protein
MYDSILVPVDETAETTRLTERAIALAATWDASLQLLGLVDGPTALSAEGTGRSDRVSGARERARRAAMRAAERAERADVDACGAVRRGVPHAEIVDEARRAGVDLVLLGPSGRETTEGAVCAGRVTSRVVDRADCAVLVERSSEEPSSESAPSEPAADRTASDPNAPSTREGQTEDRPLLVE